MGEPLYWTGRGKRSCLCEGTEGGTSGENGRACLLEGMERLHFFLAEGKRSGCREKEEAFALVKGLFAKEAEGRKTPLRMRLRCWTMPLHSGGGLRCRAGDGYLYYGADHELL